MPTRRTILSSTIAAGAAWAVTRVQDAPSTQPDLGYDKATHEEWHAASVGYYQFCKGVVQPCVVEGTGNDGKPELEVPICRPWLNVTLPASEVRNYWLQGWVGTTSKDKFQWGRPVQPPVYMLDDQRLGEHGPRGTRIGYAVISTATFFPWHGVLVEAAEIVPEAKESPIDLGAVTEGVGGPGKYRDIGSTDIWIPPDRGVDYLKGLSPPSRDPEADSYSPAVFLQSATIGATVSFGFGSELFR